LPSNFKSLNDIEVSQNFLKSLNEYFFQTYKGIGYTDFNGEEIQYFSEFHKYWKNNYKEILNANVNKEKANKTAKALIKARNKYGVGLLGTDDKTQGLSPKSIAQVRFFTANQDFRVPPEGQYERYLEDPTRFDKKEIFEEPVEFLGFLGLVSLSQSDKRTDYAKNSAKFLLKNNIEAFEIAEYYDNNAVKIREALINEKNMGYGAKKANMFLRDMAELGVWNNLKNLESIDVASDINTIKVALRTGILETEIPLLSSFLDVFCYQYSYIDNMSAKAWREVWKKWIKQDENTAPISPSQMDYLLYRIGKDYCKETLVKYECNEKHIFYYFNSHLKNCRVCAEKGERVRAYPSEKYLPCQKDASELPRENGKLLLPKTNLFYKFDGKCIFEDVCKPKSNDFIDLNPPKSISIKGRTSWTSSYSYKGKGGGGMMG